MQEAYAELGGGQGTDSGSFYSSIGGKARVGFSGALWLTVSNNVRNSRGCMILGTLKQIQ